MKKERRLWWKMFMVGVSAIPVMAFASNDVALTTDTILTVSGESLTVSGSSASIKTMSVSASAVSFDLDYGASVTLTSSSRRPFTTNDSQARVSTTCGGSESTITITSGSMTTQGIGVTIDTSTTCSSSSGSSGSSSSSGNGPVGGGGGGGGGGIGIPPSLPIVQNVPQPVQQIVTVAPSPEFSVPVTPSVSAIFTRGISLGSQNEAVSRLQSLLSIDSGLYPEASVTGYFGPATRRAVGRFQEKYNLAVPSDSAYGSVGPRTRAKLAEVFGGSSAETPSPSLVSAPPAAASSKDSITKSLKRGATHQEVKILQKILNRNSETQIASSGAGSPGSESDFYGKLTEEAVKRFQVKYGIAVEGDVGYGNVGPKTRAKLNESTE